MDSLLPIFDWVIARKERLNRQALETLSAGLKSYVRMPELQTGALHLESALVKASQILPRDVLERYVRPFHMIEGLYLLSVALAYLLHEASDLGRSVNRLSASCLCSNI